MVVIGSMQTFYSKSFVELWRNTVLPGDKPFPYWKPLPARFPFAAA